MVHTTIATIGNALLHDALMILNLQHSTFSHCKSCPDGWFIVFNSRIPENDLKLFFLNLKDPSEITSESSIDDIHLTDEDYEYKGDTTIIYC